MLFTRKGIITISKIKNGIDDFSPLDEMGRAYVDQVYSKAYVRRLFVSGKYLGKQIASIHNLAFYLELVKTVRSHLLKK